jgi:hypothetical protein
MNYNLQYQVLFDLLVYNGERLYEVQEVCYSVAWLLFFCKI